MDTTSGREANAQRVRSDDETYPALLRAIPDAPHALYVRGALPQANERLVAVVGTRRPTPYGREAATLLTRALGRAGFSIVSGLASGIDTIAHQAALEEGARTYAVLGSGIDVIYPAANRRLADRIARQGAIVSELPPGTRPLKHHFPQRNRIISGLSMGTLIVEARERSGALITAEFALEQGREVFAVPGSIFSQASVGTNRLIQQGARLARNVSDILSEFGLEAVQVAAESIGITEEPRVRNILECLRDEPQQLDVLIRSTKLQAGQVLSALTVLEVRGMVEHLGGQRYALRR